MERALIKQCCRDNEWLRGDCAARRWLRVHLVGDADVLDGVASNKHLGNLPESIAILRGWERSDNTCVEGEGEMCERINEETGPHPAYARRSHNACVEGNGKMCERLNEETWPTNGVSEGTRADTSCLLRATFGVLVNAACTDVH